MARFELLLESAVHAQVGIRQGDVGGIGSFRTHGGSAHGRGQRTYEPLAVMPAFLSTRRTHFFWKPGCS
jgi:hypothetical protein